MTIEVHWVVKNRPVLTVGSGKKVLLHRPVNRGQTYMATVSDMIWHDMT